jgi:mono/diheme cytochrome c family protein
VAPLTLAWEGLSMKQALVALVIGTFFGGLAAAEDSVEDTYKARCQACHGEDGKAQTTQGRKLKIPDMTSPDWQAMWPDAYIKRIIIDGSAKPGSKMKSFKDKLTSEEVDSLVALIRRMKGQ